MRDPGFRRQEGFPDADDERILALSDPPYYTACSNPFLEDWFAQHGRPREEEANAADEYRREPFAVDVSEGKTDPVYTAHAYHTKVPYKAMVQHRDRCSRCT